MRFIRLVLIINLGLFAGPSHAGEEDPDINYAYAVFTGTGKYSLNDRTIYVFRAPLEFDLKPVNYDAGETLGLTLLLPVAMGLTNFEDIDELPELSVDDVQSVSIVPGVEFPFALKQNWLLMPFAHAGLGVDTKSNSETFIWGTGIRSSATLGEDGNWLVGAEFLWAGERPNNNDPDNDFVRWGFGAEYKIPSERQLFGRRISWHARLIQWYFSNAVVFKPPLLPFRLEKSTEIGIAIGFSRPLNILGYKLRQAGIGFEKSDDYEAITLYASFPF